FADGLASAAELQQALGVALNVRSQAASAASAANWSAAAVAIDAANSASDMAAMAFAFTVHPCLADPPWPKAEAEERARQAVLLRDIFGIPQRPVRVDPAWLRWNAGCVAKIAQAVYDLYRFADLPVVADALEDAGCNDARLLSHCREPGDHVRG